VAVLEIKLLARRFATPSAVALSRTFAQPGCPCPRTMPQGGPPLPLHYHQDEWWYILEGQFLFEVDGRQIRAGPGATVFAPRGSRHTFQNIGSTPGRMVVTAIRFDLSESISCHCPHGAGLRLPVHAHASLGSLTPPLLSPP
jgi:mannose-6-phosphate isomerase-like protein (cupin superfamily)